ncbi:MAG: diaminopimelate epimerase [Thermodesulfobacteriota bacterium]
MIFHKYHGLGNDYILIDPAESGIEALTADQIRRICHRHYGVGSDGILLGPLPGKTSGFSLRIFNPDGSEAEKSGNGLRIFSRYLWDRCLVGTEPFTIRTPGGTVSSQVQEGGRMITVEMGRVGFYSPDIPVAGPAREVINESIAVKGEVLTFCAATIGNPHCVIQRAKALPDEARRLGPAIETDPMFPNKINVQFMEVLDRANIRLEIWERGAGYTLASGSSSAAAGAVARRLGLCDGRITVHMPGGTIRLVIADDYAVTLCGPAVKICEGRLAAEMFLEEEFDG